MKLNTAEQSESGSYEKVHLEEDIYPATLKEVRDISEGTYGPRIAFIYEISGKELALICYKTIATPDNRLGQTLLAHGAELGKEVDTENLPSKQVTAWVEDYKVKINGKETGEVASTISKVKKLTEKVG